MSSDWGNRVEAALVNIAIGLIAAGFGVFAGVRVHTAQIEDIKGDIREIKESQVRLETKVDRWIERWTER